MRCCTFSALLVPAFDFPDPFSTARTARRARHFIQLHAAITAALVIVAVVCLVWHFHFARYPIQRLNAYTLPVRIHIPTASWPLLPSVVHPRGHLLRLAAGAVFV